MKKIFSVLLLMQAVLLSAQTIQDPKVSEDILFLINEEKFARDIYQFASEKYQMQVFTNKITSEENHRTLLSGLLQDAPDIPTAYGEFKDTLWLHAFMDFKARAAISLENAMLTGALIEEQDIFDLEKRKLLTTDTAVIRIYDILISASEQHLRSFLKSIEAGGTPYVPQYLSAARVDQIRAAPNGCGGAGHSCAGSCGKGGC